MMKINLDDNNELSGYVSVYKNKSGVAISTVDEEGECTLVHLSREQAARVANAIISNCAPPLFATIIQDYPE